MTQSVRFINPEKLANPPGYTQIVEVTKGKLIYISGQVALDENGNLVGAGDMRAQCVQVMENLKSALEAVGGDFSHIIKFTYFTTDFSQIGALREVRDQYVNTAKPPASTAIQVVRLFREEFLLEVEAVAVLPE